MQVALGMFPRPIGRISLSLQNALWLHSKEAILLIGAFAFHYLN